MKSMFVVMNKELLDLARDRRTVLISLLMGPLLIVGLVLVVLMRSRQVNGPIPETETVNPYREVGLRTITLRAVPALLTPVLILVGVIGGFATVTEIYDYMRLLWARIGVPHCPECGERIQRQTVQQIADQLMLNDRTVDEYIANAVRKLTAGNRTHACARAIMLSLISP